MIIFVKIQNSAAEWKDIWPMEAVIEASNSVVNSDGTDYLTIMPLLLTNTDS